MNVNKVFLAARLTRDPQLKYLPSQSAVVEFGICCNRKWKDANGQDRDEATFVDITAFGNLATMINTHFRKGKEIYIEGRLKYDTWDDKQSGMKRSKLSVVAERVEFVGPPSDADKAENRSRPPRGSGSLPADDKPTFEEADIPF